MKTLIITQVANKIGVTHSAISQWKSKGKIPPARIFEIADILKIEPKLLHEEPNILFRLFTRGKK